MLLMLGTVIMFASATLLQWYFYSNKTTGTNSERRRQSHREQMARNVSSQRDANFLFHSKN